MVLNSGSHKESEIKLIVEPFFSHCERVNACWKKQLFALYKNLKKQPLNNQTLGKKIEKIVEESRVRRKITESHRRIWYIENLKKPWKYLDTGRKTLEEYDSERWKNGIFNNTMDGKSKEYDNRGEKGRGNFMTQ